MGARDLKRLRQYFGNKCHYCGDETNNITGHPKQGTRDHVVPRAFGGPNGMTNYVLACAACNNDRGTTLFYCSCIYCGPRIREKISDSLFIQFMFNEIIGHNRSSVRKNGAVWTVKRGYQHKSFDNFAEALEYACLPIDKTKFRRSNG